MKYYLRTNWTVYWTDSPPSDTVIWFEKYNTSQSEKSIGHMAEFVQARLRHYAGYTRVKELPVFGASGPVLMDDDDVKERGWCVVPASEFTPLSVGPEAAQEAVAPPAAPSPHHAPETPPAHREATVTDILEGRIKP